MKAFISGPMSGIEDYNTPAFMEAEKKLIESGFSVFNPAWLKVDETWSHSQLMAIDLVALAQCNIMFQLPGWKNSKGAMEEYNKANELGILVMELYKE